MGFEQIQNFLLPQLQQAFPFILKILLAVILGGMIGYEREAHGQAAGFRTNILVATGACLMMHLSLEMEQLFHHLNESSVVRLDPGRIASYAIASMGFLGAGAIIKGRGTVRGLTTASGLWLVTGLGLAIGAGVIVPAVITALVSLVVLFSFRRVFTPIIKHDVHTVLSLRFNEETDGFTEVRSIVAGFRHTQIRSVGYHLDREHLERAYKIRLLSKEDVPISELVSKLSAIPGLKSLVWEPADVP